MNVTASFPILSSALSATLPAQIPERAQWEITFPQVEAAAGLPDMRAAPPESVEARLMARSWWAMRPVPFLRLFQIDGTVRAPTVPHDSWVALCLAPFSWSRRVCEVECGNVFLPQTRGADGCCSW
jgi:hypothetical protein